MFLCILICYLYCIFVLDALFVVQLVECDGAAGTDEPCGLAKRVAVHAVRVVRDPDEARRRRLSGNLLLDVALNQDGTINDVVLRRSSGKRVLDDAAVRIVKLAAPYGKFPANIAQEVDILHIQRTWQFSTNNRFASR